MYPPVGIGQIRVAEKHDIVLGGQLHIPAGTIMWVGPPSLQRRGAATLNQKSSLSGKTSCCRPRYCTVLHASTLCS